jgi:ferredoxin
MGIEDPAIWVETMIKMFINESPENTLKNREGAWAEPIVGFSNRADLLYQFYKQDIGEFYLLPLDIFAYKFPKVKATADQLTVISWILPQTEATKSDNRNQTRFPSERWARSRVYGEEVNDKLRNHVTKTLIKTGYEAVAPMHSPLWMTQKSKQYSFASTWSERHAAYTAGLGTFGLCDGLITPKGKAMRCGSIIAKIDLSPSHRPYRDHNAYCLFYTNGSCGECINRCPAKAISKEGHDKEKCSKYLHDITRKYIKTHYHFNEYGCGLCQTSVQCESSIPILTLSSDNS